MEQHHLGNYEVYFPNDPKFVPSYRYLLKNELDGPRFFFRRMPAMP